MRRIGLAVVGALSLALGRSPSMCSLPSQKVYRIGMLERTSKTSLIVAARA
jgi:hypothetical protein